MKALRLTLVCSGITQGMRKQEFPLDRPLEKRSIDLAHSLRPRLAAADRALSAPALRARQTADLLGLDATVREDLRDQDHGVWAGKAVSEVEALEPGALAAWLTDPAYAQQGGESVADVSRRTAAFLDEMRGASGHVIAVTHGAVVRAAIVHVLAAPLSAFRHIDAPPLGLTDLRHNGSRWVLRAHAFPE
ncbi:MAG: histidine phosphatase family protein [Parvibaculaceae bacterium]